MDPDDIKLYDKMIVSMVYRFFKNPWYTLKYWDEPIIISFYLDVNDEEIVPAIHYIELLNYDYEYMQFLRYQKPLNKQDEHMYHLHLAPWEFGTKQVEWNSVTIYWDDWKYYRELTPWRDFKVWFYYVNGYSYLKRKKRRTHRWNNFKAFHERHHIFDKLFFKNKVRKKEFMGKMDTEELLRTLAKNRRRGVTDRRKLKTRSKREL